MFEHYQNVFFEMLTVSSMLDNKTTVHVYIVNRQDLPKKPDPLWGHFPLPGSIQYQRFLLLQKRKHFKLFEPLYMCVFMDGCSILSDFLRPHGRQPARLLSPWDFPGKNTGVGCYALFQGIVLTQGSNPGLLRCRQILYLLSHQGSPSATTKRSCMLQLRPGTVR